MLYTAANCKLSRILKISLFSKAYKCNLCLTLMQNTSWKWLQRMVIHLYKHWRQLNRVCSSSRARYEPYVCSATCTCAYVYINKSEQMDVYEHVRVFMCVVTRKQADITVLRCKHNLPCCAWPVCSRQSRSCLTESHKDTPPSDGLQNRW